MQPNALPQPAQDDVLSKIDDAKQCAQQRDELSTGSECHDGQAYWRHPVHRTVEL
jgi:hypothetical protein